MILFNGAISVVVMILFYSITSVVVIYWHDTIWLYRLCGCYLLLLYYFLVSPLWLLFVVMILFYSITYVVVIYWCDTIL